MKRSNWSLYFPQRKPALYFSNSRNCEHLGVCLRRALKNINRFFLAICPLAVWRFSIKWFYGNLEDAQNWAGQAAARDGGPLTILQTTVPKTVAPVYFQPWVDSIQNPALFYNIGDLNAPIKVVSPPITGGAK